jgi:hypothetical protein
MNLCNLYEFTDKTENTVNFVFFCNVFMLSLMGTVLMVTMADLSIELNYSLKKFLPEPTSRT